LSRSNRNDSAYQIAEVYAFRSESDKSFEWLERAYKQRDAGLPDIKVDPVFSSLRRDLRFTELLRSCAYRHRVVCRAPGILSVPTVTLIFPSSYINNLMQTSSGTTSLTWQFSQYRPPISSAGATTPAHTEVGGSLRNGLPLDEWFTLRRQLLICLVDDPLGATADRCGRPKSVAMASGMHSRRAHTTAYGCRRVEGNSEEDIRRLRSAAGYQGLIGRPFKVGILEIDVGVAVPRRRQIESAVPRTILHRCHDGRVKRLDVAILRDVRFCVTPGHAGQSSRPRPAHTNSTRRAQDSNTS